MKPNAAVRFSFYPRGSQILSVLFGLAGSISAFVTMYFCLMANPWIALVPGGFAFAFVSLAVACWSKSYANADLGNAAPTTVQNPDGSLLSFDTRALFNPAAMTSLGALVQMTANRALLPKPDGLVTTSGAPDPSRAEEAATRVATLNNVVQLLATEITAGLARVGGTGAATPLHVGEFEPGALSHVNVIARKPE